MIKVNSQSMAKIAVGSLLILGTVCLAIARVVSKD